MQESVHRAPGPSNRSARSSARLRLYGCVLSEWSGARSTRMGPIGWPFSSTGGAGMYGIPLSNKGNSMEDIMGEREQFEELENGEGLMGDATERHEDDEWSERDGDKEYSECVARVTGVEAEMYS